MRSEMRLTKVVSYTRKSQVTHVAAGSETANRIVLADIANRAIVVNVVANTRFNDDCASGTHACSMAEETSAMCQRVPS